MQAVQVEVALAGLAAGQWGLFTTQQAQHVGVSRVRLSRLTKAGALLRLAHGVYVLRGASGTGHLELRAAWLAFEPTLTASERVADGAKGVVVSHTSAADLYGFGDLDADRHEFTTSVRKQTRRSDVRFHRSYVSNADVTLRDGLPVTTPARLIVDLLADDHDGGHVADVLADAVRSRAIVVGDLPERLAPFANRFGLEAGDGQGLLDQLLDLGGALDQVVADQLTDIARADNKSLAELLSIAVGNQALTGLPNILGTAAFTNVFTTGVAGDALANLAHSPALAAAAQSAANSSALAPIAQSPALKELLHNSQLTNAIAALTQSPAVTEALRHSPAIEAISKMMQSPAIAAAIRNSTAADNLIANLARPTRPPATSTRRALPAATENTAPLDDSEPSPA